MIAQMLVANRGPLEDLVGFEVVSRAARLVLIDSVNDEIDRVQERWRAADLLFEEDGNDAGIAALGLDHISSDNIFQGPHKSLLGSPISRFPNVSVTGYAVRPGAGDALNDVHRNVEVSLLVEMIVVAGPIGEIGDDLFCESLAHRRIERTSEAVLAAIGRSQNLLGTVITIGQARGGIVNASWIKRTDGGNEQAYVLHGARFQYAPQRQASRYG